MYSRVALHIIIIIVIRLRKVQSNHTVPKVHSILKVFSVGM